METNCVIKLRTTTTKHDHRRDLYTQLLTYVLTYLLTYLHGCRCAYDRPTVRAVV